MARTKKKKLLTRDMRIQIAKDNYMKWLKSIGVRLDSKGRVINNFKGYIFLTILVIEILYLRVIE